MPTQSPIHIMMGYNESLETKRGILYSEMSSLKIAQQIGRYANLRMAELSVKSKMYSKIKETRLNIKKLQEMIPVPVIPRILKRPQISVRSNETREIPVTTINPTSDVESQLREIQKRLEELQRKSNQ